MIPVYALEGVGENADYRENRDDSPEQPIGCLIADELAELLAEGKREPDVAERDEPQEDVVDEPGLLEDVKGELRVVPVGILAPGRPAG